MIFYHEKSLFTTVENNLFTFSGIFTAAVFQKFRRNLVDNRRLLLYNAIK